MYKVGDVVEVIDNTSLHSLKIGEKATITYVQDVDDFGVEWLRATGTRNSHIEWHIKTTECRPIESVSNRRAASLLKGE